MNVTPQQLYNIIFVVICLYIILSGIKDILNTVTTKNNTVGSQFQSWTDALFRILAGLSILYLMYQS